MFYCCPLHTGGNCGNITKTNQGSKTMIDRKKDFKIARDYRGTWYAVKSLVHGELIYKRVWLEHKSWKIVLVLCALEIVEVIQWLS